jgi:hypothetical protein
MNKTYFGDMYFGVTVMAKKKNKRTTTLCKSPKIFFLLLASLDKIRTNRLVWPRIEKNIFGD